jgi:hypothetical protein
MNFSELPSILAAVKPLFDTHPYVVTVFALWLVYNSNNKKQQQ